MPLIAEEDEGVSTESCHNPNTMLTFRLPDQDVTDHERQYRMYGVIDEGVRTESLVIRIHH